VLSSLESDLVRGFEDFTDVGTTILSEWLLVSYHTIAAGKELQDNAIWGVMLPFELHSCSINATAVSNGAFYIDSPL